jgi:hypothetical protein
MFTCLPDARRRSIGSAANIYNKVRKLKITVMSISIRYASWIAEPVRARHGLHTAPRDRERQVRSAKVKLGLTPGFGAPNGCLEEL